MTDTSEREKKIPLLVEKLRRPGGVAVSGPTHYHNREYLSRDEIETICCALDGGAVSQGEALEFIAKCCRLGLLDRGTTLVDELAAQIASLRQPQPDTRERDLSLIGFCRELCQSYFVGNNEDALAAFQRIREEK